MGTAFVPAACSQVHQTLLCCIRSLLLPEANVKVSLQYKNVLETKIAACDFSFFSFKSFELLKFEQRTHITGEILYYNHFHLFLFHFKYPVKDP